MTTTPDTAALIEECIAYNGAELADCEPEFRHFWDGWDPEAVKRGIPAVRITTQSPGLGHTTRINVMLVIELPDGKGDAAVRDQDYRAIPSKWMRRKGREAYCRDLARRLYGDIPATYKALV